MSPRLAAEISAAAASGGLISSGVYFAIRAYCDVKGRFYAVFSVSGVVLA
jgi:hypothetical protein